MSCGDCHELCARRKVALPERSRQLCAADPRYAALLDQRFGVADETVLPDCVSGPSAPPTLPSLARQATNAAKAGAKFVRSGFRLASEDTQQTRIAACEACEWFLSDVRRCAHEQCGCYVDAKVKVASESCPIGQWSEEPRPTRNPPPRASRKGGCAGCSAVTATAGRPPDNPERQGP